MGIFPTLATIGITMTSVTSTSCFRKACPACARAGDVLSREKMPPSQMLWGKKLDDISDFSWVTERQVSCKKAGAYGRSPVVENQQGTNEKRTSRNKEQDVFAK